jgi:hypothetical protein
MPADELAAEADALVHHDDVATALVTAARRGRAGRLQPRRRGNDHGRRPRPRAVDDR